MKNEKWDDVHGNTTPDDRMVAFLESPTDSYAILQLREDVDDNIPLMFANYSYLQKKEMEPEIDRYEVVYHGSISMSEDVNRQLEDLYVKFNIDHPDDFRGHSMSVSDIVALKVVGEVSFPSLPGAEARYPGYCQCHQCKCEIQRPAGMGSRGRYKGLF